MTTVNASNSLLRGLAKGYPTQARNLASDPILIRIDEYDSSHIDDYDSSHGFSGCCDIYLRLSGPDADEFTLILDNVLDSVPFDDDVKAVTKELDGIWETRPRGQTLTLQLAASQTGEIRRVSTAIRKVVKRGKRLPYDNWKWNAPLTAEYLDRLASVLDRSSQRQS